MSKLWFVLHNDTVTGPIEASDLDKLLDESGEPQKALVWWRGQTEWTTADLWRQNLPKILKSFELSPEKKAFFLDYMGERLGPLSVNEIALRVKSMKSIDDVRLWSTEVRRWQSVYDVGPLCDLLGLTRRNHARVPMVGSCVVQKDSFKAIAGITSISIGGVGIQLEADQKISGVVALELRSPSLFNSIRTRAEVAYVKENGAVGLKFLTLSLENQSSLIEYIKNFESAKAA